MSLLKKLFGKREPINSYTAFWIWFREHEKSFHKVVKEKRNVEKNFFDKISPKLNQLKDGFFYLTGMFDENTVELVFTADGAVKNIVFIEELVHAAPKLDGWLFTALKPAIDIKNLSIEMSGYKFNDQNLSFYATEHANFPDEIDVTIVHNGLDEENKTKITNGTYIFLDNFLGEMNFVTTIDTISVASKNEARQDLIPIAKLKDFLIWRQKEFIEKYEGVRHDTENDNYSALEAKLENGNALIAIINTDLLSWDSKASHPWVLNIEIKYDGQKNRGMPDSKTLAVLTEIESAVSSELRDADGYLNIGRQTADNTREIYFACKDFRKPSKILFEMQQKYADRYAINFDIYKDKYWQSFERFVSV
jgi:hypothetical protein